MTVPVEPYEPGGFSADGTEIHEAPVLQGLLEEINRRRPVHALDLGPASRRNLEALSAFATKVRFLDLLGRSDGGDLRRLDRAEFTRWLDTLLPVGRDAFDLYLTWHCFDYLGHGPASVLAGRLAAVSAGGALLHLMVATAESIPAEPTRFEMIEDGRLAGIATTLETAVAPGTPPAVVERWLEPFRIQRSVLLRHGVREISAKLT